MTKPILAVASCLGFLYAGVAQAQVQTWHDIGEYGGPLLWATGLSSSLFQDGRAGTLHATRTLDGFLVAGGATELLKYLTREKRPYADSLDSFPSLHASLSFEVAAAQSYYHPHQAPIWYGAATLISAARVLGHDHHIQDVLVGALIGFAAGQLAASSQNHETADPFVSNRHHGFMLSFSSSF